jgi:hypothetical protein
MALLATRTHTKFWSKRKDVPEKTAIDVHQLFKALVKSKWGSSGLPDGNAFTAALVVRTAGFLVMNAGAQNVGTLELGRYPVNDKGDIDPEVADKKLSQIVETKAKFKENAKSKEKEPPFSVSGYPSKASIVYWFVDGAISAKMELGRSLKDVAEWAKAEFHRQLIYLSASNDSLMDPPELAMAACLINRIRRLCDERIQEQELVSISRLLPSQVELRFAVERVLLEQPEPGIWHKYFPLFHFPTGSGAAEPPCSRSNPEATTGRHSYLRN